MVSGCVRGLCRGALALAGVWCLAGCTLATDLSDLSVVSASSGSGGTSSGGAGHGGAGSAGAGHGGAGSGGTGTAGSAGVAGSGIAGNAGQAGSVSGAGQGGAGQGGESGQAGNEAAGQGGAGESGAAGQGGAGGAAGEGGAAGGGGAAGEAGAGGQAGEGGQGGSAGQGPSCAKGESECDPELGLSCDQTTGECVGPCAPQGLGKSHVGCEFWASVTSHGALLKAFPFGVLLTNTSDQPAQVRVYQGAKLVAEAKLAAHASAELPLPWVDELLNPYSSGQPDAVVNALKSSSLAVQSGYHIKATQPLVVHQFSPLVTALSPPPSGCDADPCEAATLGASLLFPVQSLDTKYIVASLGTRTLEFLGWEPIQFPGFVTVVATQDDTLVSLVPTAFIRSGSGVVGAEPGELASFLLNRGDVLQLLSGSAPAEQFTKCTSYFSATFCSTPSQYDLTGSVLSSSRPIAVLTGHDLAQVPVQDVTNDHIEEMLPPLAAWGKQVVVAAPQAALDAEQGTGKADTQTIRVISGDDDNEISLVPNKTKFTLSKGQYKELNVAQLDFEVKGTGKLLVMQLTRSPKTLEDALGAHWVGDPSMTFAVPVEQYGTQHPFSAPSGVPFNFAIVISQKGDTVTLDGTSVGQAAAAIADSSFEVRRIKVGPGPHLLQSGQPSGLVLQGYATETGYLAAGSSGLTPLP